MSLLNNDTITIRLQSIGSGCNRSVEIEKTFHEDDMTHSQITELYFDFLRGMGFEFSKETELMFRDLSHGF